MIVLLITAAAAAATFVAQRDFPGVVLPPWSAGLAPAAAILSTMSIPWVTVPKIV